MPAAYGAQEAAPVAAVLLAAGQSSRMGSNKLLLPWHGGQPILVHVARQYLEAGLAALVVVTGYDAAALRSALATLALDCVHNPEHAQGEMLSSLQLGLRALMAAEKRFAAAFIQPADMPGVSAKLIRSLQAQAAPGWDVAPSYRGQRGHPVLLARERWQAMLDLPPGAMPRAALDARRLRLLPVDDAGVLLDVDTRQAYKQALAAQG